ncbi:MAG: hypoxanthine-guanine phosphoribosyltransferase [Gammaproteobacteria bacterium]|jgi:hypoxanthine phosphoribosyltransferase|nr:hypoxanthine-guanine phosphoribosyltransferase [Gammaproteobacteria bacterium]MDG2337359.1 hypoxanthine-guanine phosphoribosyltransferase [Gammaproteobacteria bacterium]
MTPELIEEIAGRSTCLHDEGEVESALDYMAASISAELSSKNPLLICIMHGGLIISGKLATRLDFPLQMDYLHATRYRAETSGKDLQWKVYPSESLRGRHVLLVDDILDVGTTLKLVVEYCRQQGCESVHTAVLLDKHHTRKEPGVVADFVGLEVADYYLFGYGMDYKGYLRNATGIFAIAEKDM